MNPEAAVRPGEPFESGTTPRASSVTAPVDSAWSSTWIRLTLVCAVAASLLDAALLQRKHDLFTGGFLSVDHLRGPAEIVLFALASVIADAGVAGVIVAAALAVSSMLRLGTVARFLFVLGAGFLPFVLANVASYRILEYLGGAFDFALLFDLSGRRPSEILAVASAPLGQFGMLVLIATTLLSVAVFGAQRIWPSHAPAAPHGRSGAVVRAVALLLIAFVMTTAFRLSRESLDNGLRRKPSGMVLGWPAAIATDFDGDGYGMLSRVADPAPFDSRIHPYAVDIPGNGIDENGVGGDLPLDFPRYVEPSGAAPQFTHRPDVVLILLESFRADVVGARLDGKPVTPTLDALAARGVSSQDAWSHNGYTVQSRFHLLSGSLANLRGGTTLIDDFLANGYEVAYFSGQDESFGGGALPVGYERASVFFDARQARDERYTLFSTPGSLAVPFTVLRDRVIAFLQSRDRSRPLFLYVNFHDTHFPYTHRHVEPLVDTAPLQRSDIAPGRREALWRTYLNTAANVDRAVGDVMDSVRTTTGREPGIIVTADHGESLFEEGFLGHGYGLNEAQTRVPLIVSALPMSIEQPWGQVDLRDALLQALSTGSPGADPSLARGKRPVFQYLGQIAIAPQIAFRADGSQSAYDARTNQFRGGGGPLQSTGVLAPPDREGFLALVRFWESMLGAQGPQQ